MSTRKKIKLKYKNERVLLSDVLPYETPLIFSNRYFYRFLVSNGVKIQGEFLYWNECISDGAFRVLSFIFDISCSKRDSKCKIKNRITIPFIYHIEHQELKYRDLAIIHPCNQAFLVDFYEEYKYSIIYYCGISNFSIRYPNKIACFFYYRDKMHKKLLGNNHDKIELYFNEYENLRTFFTYKRYTNIYKFYENYPYQRAEKKYKYLFRLDIQSCFDNIYTHSIAWSTYSCREVFKKAFNNYSPKERNNGFAYEFDCIMQKMNYNETNGILIGPEFSRIFSEIILQSIDKYVEVELLSKQYFRMKDYECYRYVDDYFFFYNNECVFEEFKQLLVTKLKEFKLSIGDTKSEKFQRPFISKISTAKKEIDKLLEDEISFKNKDVNDESEELNPSEDPQIVKVKDAISSNINIFFLSRKFNLNLKSILFATNVSYKDISNYTLFKLNIRIELLLKKFDAIYKTLVLTSNSSAIVAIREQCDRKKERYEKMITNLLLEIIESVFFIYNNNKRINTTLKLLSVINLIVVYIKTNYYEEESSNKFTSDTRKVILQKIRNEVIVIFKTSCFNEQTQLETMYLFILLKDLGSNYYLGPELISSFFKQFEHSLKLNYFSIIILLYYFGNVKKYKDLKDKLIEIIKMKYKGKNNTDVRISAELSLLSLDLLSCPYIDTIFKKEVLAYMGINDNEKKVLDYFKLNSCIFTKWSKIDFNSELNSKISQEVYS